MGCHRGRCEGSRANKKNKEKGVGVGIVSLRYGSDEA
jgi:hypothetical protein